VRFLSIIFIDVKRCSGAPVFFEADVLKYIKRAVRDAGPYRKSKV
jgi:hypothetical protein